MPAENDAAVHAALRAGRRGIVRNLLVDARLIERWRTGDERPEILTQSLTWSPAGTSEQFELPLPPLFAEAHGDNL